MNTTATDVEVMPITVIIHTGNSGTDGDGVTEAVGSGEGEEVGEAVGVADGVFTVN